MSRRTAFVTGAGRGVGRAIALRFARDGYAVAAAGRSGEYLAQVSEALAATGVDVLPILCDVAVREDVTRAVAEAEQQLGPIDVLVNNAGVSESASFATMDDEMWERMLAVNLSGTYYCMRAVIPGMFACIRSMLLGRWPSFARPASGAADAGASPQVAFRPTVNWEGPSYVSRTI